MRPNLRLVKDTSGTAFNRPKKQAYYRTTNMQIKQHVCTEMVILLKPIPKCNVDPDNTKKVHCFDSISK